MKAITTPKAKVLRRASGQALVEGACIIPVMILLVVFLCFFLVNTSIVGTYNYRLNAIAAEAARQYNSGKWWIGMERPFFNEAKAEEDMIALIDAEVKASGLGDVEITNHKFTRHEGKADGETIGIMRVEFDVTNLKCVSYGVFPTRIKLHATGMACDAEYAFSKHGMALLHVVDDSDPTQPPKERGIRVPILNASRGESQPADSTPGDPWLTAGSTLGTPPIVTMTIYAKHFGQLTMQQTNENGNSTVSEPRQWLP